MFNQLAADQARERYNSPVARAEREREARAKAEFDLQRAICHSYRSVSTQPAAAQAQEKPANESASSAANQKGSQLKSNNNSPC